MVNEHALTVSLEEFGLSKYEAQAYVTMLVRGTSAASEIAYYSEIPRTKIYPTLLKLKNKKLAIISKGKPIRCTPIAPEDVFDGIIQEQINKVNAMNVLVSNLKKASEEGRKAKGSEEKRYTHISANNVLAQLQYMIEESKSSIRIMADQWGMGLLAECRRQILDVLRKDVDVRMVVPPQIVCSEPYRTIPAGVEIRAHEIIQNCFIFDETELLMVSSSNAKGAVFPYTEILGVSQDGIFASVWKSAARTRALDDMTKAEAQEIYKMVRVVNEGGLVHMLDPSAPAKKSNAGLTALLENNGIHLGSRSFDDVVGIVDAAMQMTCSGHVNFETSTNNITVTSKINSGHSMPWVTVLNDYLNKHGYKTRTIFQNGVSRGEKIHIKINKE